MLRDIAPIILIGGRILRSCQLLPSGLNTPDFTSVLCNCTIRREFTTGSNVIDGHFQPFGLILKETKNINILLSYRSFRRKFNMKSYLICL